MRDDFTTRPKEEVDFLDFKELLRDKPLEISPHALDHICKQQRKLYIEEQLTNLIKKQKPRKVYKQANGRLSVSYRFEEGYREVILELEETKVVIVSFMDNIEIPTLKK